MLMFVAVGGLVVAYIAKSLMAVSEPPRARPPATRSVPMAVANLEPGTIITDKHLGLGTMNVSDIKGETLLTERVIIGRVVKQRISAATPIQSSQLYGPDEFPPLQVTEGMRAVSVDLSPSVAMVDGMIQPGQYVDIHLTTNGSGNDARYGGGLTMTIFKGVRVLAINRTASTARVDRGGNNVTLELTPEQANIMILARSKGDITLSYNPQGKGTGGVSVASEDRATFEEILGLKPLPKPEPPFQSEVYRGTGRAVLQFRNGVLLNSNVTIDPQSPQDTTTPGTSDDDGSSANPTSVEDVPAPTA